MSTTKSAAARPIRLVSSLYSMYLALLASPIMNPDTIQIDSCAGVDPSHVDAVRAIVRDARLSSSVQPLTEGELHEELSIMFGGRPNEVLQAEIQRLTGENSALARMAREANDRAVQESASRGETSYALRNLQGRIDHMTADMTCAMENRPVYQDMDGDDKSDPEILTHKVLETMHALDKGSKALAASGEELALAARKSIRAHRVDLTLIALAMGIPMSLASEISTDVLVETLHSLHCPDDGSIAMIGVDSCDADAQGAARSKMMQDAFEKATAKIASQKEKSEKTMAEQGRAKLSDESKPINMAALIEQLAGTNLDTDQEEALEELRKGAQEDATEGEPEEGHHCDECDEIESAKRGQSEVRSVADERIGKLPSDERIQALLSNLFGQARSKS